MAVEYNGKKLAMSVTIETQGIKDIATAEEMDALLVEANIGNVYRYTGTTTEKYTNGDLYEVVSE